MRIILAQSLPIVALVILGFALKQGQIIDGRLGQDLARLILNTTLPAVIFLSLARARLDVGRLGILALCGGSIPLVLHLVAIAASRRMGLERKVAGVVVVGSLVTNIGFFLLPFFQAFYGPEGVSRLAAFDLGNSLLAASYGYYVAARYGGRAAGGRAILRQILAAPLLWANLAGISVNLLGLGQALPEVLVKVLEPLAAANTPLAMLTVGSFIEPHLKAWRPVSAAVAIRVGLGFALGQLLVWALGLSGLERAAVGMGGAMPIGTVAIVYAALQGLDLGVAAGSISLSIVVALLITPFLLRMY